MRRIDRHPVLDVPAGRHEVAFHFDGLPVRGFDGEMISSALFANGIQRFSVHQKEDAPRGIFCANGQCAQCTVVVDGFPLKSCVTPLREGMDVRTLHHLPELPPDDAPLAHQERIEHTCDVLVVGGGPSGLTAAVELARLGLQVLLVEDKDRLGGKLLLQTHKFFGSIEDCHAGVRGVDIATLLEAEARACPTLRILTDAVVVGVYNDRKAGLFVANRTYELVSFQGMVVSAGARERSLVFPGNDLPGVYGAGAFQTLVNRDLVRAADRVLIVGSGNVGLIGAYHALQAGISVVGIVDILDRPSGYKVHADKIKRMGVPLLLGHTILSVEGDGRVERATVARVDASWKPLLETAITWEVDTVLVAVGLTPVDEFFTFASRFGFPVVKAGDAEEIAEASSAMFGGRLAGRRMARLLGHDVPDDPAWQAKAEVLRSRPGTTFPERPFTLTDAWKPVLHCLQEIPCNPCTSVCPEAAIELQGGLGTLMDLPVLTGTCKGCRLCVSICPGLAIVLARRTGPDTAEVILPHEFLPTFKVGDTLPLTDRDGAFLQDGRVVKVTQHRKHRTWYVQVAVTPGNAPRVAGIRVQDPATVAPLPSPSLTWLPEEGIVCRCERVTVREIIEHIRRFGIRDVNQLKQVRAGMGSCGAKTCSTLFPQVFRQAGVPVEQVERGTLRPLTVEVPMYAILNEKVGSKP